MSFSLRCAGSAECLAEISTNEFRRRHQHMTIIDVNADIGRKFGEVQAGLLDRGKPAPPLDLLIAATALVHGYTVVSHNTADFQNVPGLKVVDWLAP